MARPGRIAWLATLTTLGSFAASLPAQGPGDEPAIVRKRAEIEYLEARLKRVRAELSNANTTRDFVDHARSELARAKVDQARAEERLRWMRRLGGKKYVSGSLFAAGPSPTRKARAVDKLARAKMARSSGEAFEATLADLRREVAIAEAGRQGSESRSEWSRKVHAMQFLSDRHLEDERQSAEEFRMVADRVKAVANRLEAESGPREAVRSALERLRADESAKKAAFESAAGAPD